MFNEYPYTDFHELNTDWIIGKIKNVETAEANTKQYAEDADAAKVAAQEAQTAAENAQTAAENAQTGAEDAQRLAENARDDAQTAADSVQSTRDQINVLQARVDNIIPDGTQTAGNTELLDIRVGYDGTVYDSAGDAVRAQVSDINTELNDVIATPSSNLFDKSAASTGGYYGGSVNGITYGTPSDWVTDASYQDTGLIPYDKNKTYAANISDHSLVYMRLWDSNKGYLGIRTPSQITWTGDVFAPNVAIGSNPAYMSLGISANEDLDTLMVCENQLPGEYEPYGYILKVVSKTEYDSKMNEIDTDIADLQNVIERPSVNLFDKSAVSAGGYYGGSVNGITYGTPSDWVTNAAYQDTGLIAFNKNNTYAANVINQNAVYLRFWDADKKYIGMRQPSEITWTGNVFTPNPMGINPVYVSMAISSSEDINDLMVCQDAIPDHYEPYGDIVTVVTIDNINSYTKGEYPTYGKKLGCLGDSLTAGAGGTSWVTKMQSMCGFDTVINYGVSGSTISDVQQDGTSFIERYPAMDNDLDYLTIWGGVNDILYRAADADQFKAKFETLISGVRTMLPECKILIITPMKFDVSGTPGARTERWDQARLYDGDMPAEYIQAEIEIAEKYCIKVLNAWTCSGIFVDLQKSELMPDGIHPNTKGNLQYLAPLIAKELETF